MTRESDGARWPDGAPAADVRASGEGSALAAERQAKPYTKAAQLARGERRYRRKVASPKQWQAIIEAKRGPCRVCVELTKPVYGRFTLTPRPVEYHHLVARSLGGDDVQDNIVPLCSTCHAAVTLHLRNTLAALAASLTDAEYAYVIGKLGEGGVERLLGVGAR